MKIRLISSPPLLTVFALATLLLAACSNKENSDSVENTPQGENSTRSNAFTPESFGNINRNRLLNIESEPDEWLTEGRDFGKSHYSPLDEINLDNIQELGFAWEYRTDTHRGMESNPIVVDGVVYTSGTTGRAYALNAVTGEEIWSFNPESDGQVNRYTCCDEVNRGLAVWEGMVYVGSLDGRLFALDAESGELIWEVDTFIFKDRAYTSSGAPEIAGDVVVIGNAGADYDARGYVSAYDLKTGELSWRFFTVPGDPELGFEHPEMELAAQTWDPDSRWDVGGGGTAWNSMVYDPELNLIYIGTGNSALFNWHERSPSGGDNLFLCSILAINPDTGEMVWYYQQVPRESWDYTATQPMILADLEFDGEMRKVVMQAPKAGFFYILDRATGELLSADPYVPVNWATHVDLETGRPQMSSDVDYDFGKPPIFIEPSGMGGHAWNPMAFNPNNKLVYIPSIEGGAMSYDTTDGHTYRPKQGNNGNSILFGDMMTMNPDLMQDPVRAFLAEVQDAGKSESRAALKAFDPATGELVWEVENEGWWDRAGVLSTAGGLVFQGTDSGFLRVYHEATGEMVHEIFIGSSIIAAPVSYSVNGEQYIAFLTGWGGGGWFAPHPTSAVINYGNQGRILALKLGGSEVPLPDLLSEIDPIPEPPVENIAAADIIAEGQQLFSRSCAICHANTDYGLTPDLRRMTADTHAGFLGIVLYGARRFQGMPQWDDVLNEEQTNSIHAYLVDMAWRAYEAQENNQVLETAPDNTTGH
jgi:quinohemoprotein ethanol dehydrogenase